MAYFFSIIRALLLITCLPFTSYSQGKLIISITDCRNSKGDIKYIVFNQSKGFPSDPLKSYKRGSGQIVEKKSQITLTNIPYGAYAISILHDENNNGRMDFNILGMPKEGYGVSNDANRTFGPPKYEEAKIELNHSSEAIVIKLVYW